MNTIYHDLHFNEEMALINSIIGSFQARGEREIRL